MDPCAEIRNESARCIYGNSYRRIDNDTYRIAGIQKGKVEAEGGVNQLRIITLATLRTIDLDSTTI